MHVFWFLTGVIVHQVVLKHFFLALALGAAMPLNYALITFFIIVTFWIDKYNVLRLYKKPAEVNHQVRMRKTEPWTVDLTF